MPIHINHLYNIISTGENADVPGNNVIIFSNTGALVISKGTTSQRPAAPVSGMIRYNTTLNFLEVYNNNAWRKIFSGNVEDLTGPNNEYIIDGFSHGPSAQNYLKISNANISNSPKITVEGPDTDIDINISPKNNGKVIIGEGPSTGYISSDQGENLVLIGGKNIQLIPTSSHPSKGEIKIFSPTSAEIFVFDSEKTTHYSNQNSNSHKNSYVIRLTTTNTSIANYSIKLLNNSVNFIKSYIIGIGDSNTNRFTKEIDSVIYVHNSTAIISYMSSKTYVLEGPGPLSAISSVSGDSVEIYVIGATAITNWTVCVNKISVL